MSDQADRPPVVDQAPTPVVDQGRPRPRGDLDADNVAVLQILKGNPTPEELAALTAVVLALQSAEDAAPARPTQRHWVRRAALNLAPRPGPGAWRRSRA